MKKPLRISFAVVAAFAAATIGALTARHVFHPATPPPKATLLNPPRPLPEFSLVDHQGESFTRERFENRWTLLFFGFTNCPDVCPMTLHTLARVYAALEEQGPNSPDVVFISVDPMRDTQEQLAKYVPYFHADFVGVTGELPDIQGLTRELGVAVSYAPAGDSYTVDHTASVFLVNPKGQIEAIFTTPHTVRDIASDFRTIATTRGRS